MLLWTQDVNNYMPKVECLHRENTSDKHIIPVDKKAWTCSCYLIFPRVMQVVCQMGHGYKTLANATWVEYP